MLRYLQGKSTPLVQRFAAHQRCILNPAYTRGYAKPPKDEKKKSSIKSKTYTPNDLSPEVQKNIANIYRIEETKKKSVYLIKRHTRYNDVITGDLTTDDSQLNLEQVESAPTPRKARENEEEQTEEPTEILSAEEEEKHIRLPKR